jgi:hypothetical protein
MANAHGPNSPRTSAKALVELTIGSVPECLIVPRLRTMPQAQSTWEFSL